MLKIQFYFLFSSALWNGYYYYFHYANEERLFTVICPRSNNFQRQSEAPNRLFPECGPWTTWYWPLLRRGQKSGHTLVSLSLREHHGAQDSVTQGTMMSMACCARRWASQPVINERAHFWDYCWVSVSLTNMFTHEYREYVCPIHCGICGHKQNFQKWAPNLKLQEQACQNAEAGFQSSCIIHGQL